MAGELALDYYGYTTSISKPSTLLNSIFMWTVNTAAKTLVAVASSAKIENADGRWRAVDHLRFMVMLMTWFTVWVLRVLMDYFPSCSDHGRYQLEGLSSSSVDGSFDLAIASVPSLSSAPSSSSTSYNSSSDLVLQEEGCDEHGPSSIKALGRALSHIFALLNDIPASSRKYQFAVAMADKIVDENARNGDVHLLQINRAALSSAFSRTAGLLHRSIQTRSQLAIDDSAAGAWTSRLIGSLPLGSYITSYLQGLSSLCLGAIFPNITGTSQLQKRWRMAASCDGGEDVLAEKHAQELLWITNKLRACGAVDEALTQWSLFSGLASLSLRANPRVQGFIVKISAILFGELLRSTGGWNNNNYYKEEAGRQVKFRLLVLWLPLFCYAENGIAYPVLTGYEKAEMERTIDEVISSLPAIDQEVILTNWLQDFAISSSDWPNLQISYDRWCRTTRKHLII